MRGASLALSIDPGEVGRGLYLALAPSWGNASSGVRALWEDRHATARGPDGRDPFVPKMRWTSELGYAEPVWKGRGVLTSYGAFPLPPLRPTPARPGTTVSAGGWSSMTSCP